MAERSNAPFMTLYMPPDPDLRAAFGRVSIGYGHLDYMLRMMIKTLAGITGDRG